MQWCFLDPVVDDKMLITVVKLTEIHDLNSQSMHTDSGKTFSHLLQSIHQPKKVSPTRQIPELISFLKIWFRLHPWCASRSAVYMNVWSLLFSDMAGMILFKIGTRKIHYCLKIFVDLFCNMIKASDLIWPTGSHFVIFTYSSWLLTNGQTDYLQPYHKNKALWPICVCQISSDRTK